jgi:hypothetical protein
MQRTKKRTRTPRTRRAGERMLGWNCWRRKKEAGANPSALPAVMFLIPINDHAWNRSESCKKRVDVSQPHGRDSERAW